MSTRFRLLVGLVAAVLGGVVHLGSAPAAHAVSSEVVYHRITFPVMGATSYSDTFGACRSGCAREHEGTDIMGTKLQPLVAAADGRIGWSRTDGNNMFSIRGKDGWSYTYIHVNNDTPGTDDGANPAEWIFAPGIGEGSEVVAGQFVGYLGDSGNAEGTSPHLHFELHKPDGTPVNAYSSLMLAQGRRVNDRCSFDDNPVAKPSIKAAPGYWSTTADGSVYAFGGAPYHGGMGGQPLAKPVIGMTTTSDGGGYWQLASDGGIFSFGNARFFGSTGAMRLNQPVVGMAATPSGNGYWLVASDGGIFSFGDARFFGSTGAMRLNKPVIGMASTPTGNGYWLVASDGGVFSFGDAGFLGSTGGNTMVPIVDITPTTSGKGYWMTTTLGSVLPFGDAEWQGGVDKVGFCEVPAAVALTPTRTGDGYWIQTRDGNVFAFGDAVDHGSPRRLGFGNRPAVAIAAP
jgi:murein DD-endopeptidase MepM/ murein hydrolase activator NlpD